MADEEGPKLGDGAVIGGGDGKDVQELVELYAFIAVVGDKTSEMVIAMPTPRGIMPLITSHADQIDSMEVAAQEFADESKTDVKLVKFTKTETVRTVGYRTVQPGPQIVH